jgi:hypothetical protein
VTYELINLLTTNTLGAFDDEDEALSEFETVTQEDDPENQDAYALIAFDDEGRAQQVVAGPREAAMAFVGVGA